MDPVAAIEAFVTAIATAVLAAFTWLLWKATQRMASATSEASVVASLEPSRASFIHMELVVENTGAGPAFDVQIAFEPPLTRPTKDPSGVGTAPLSSISLLRPSQAIRDYIGPASHFLDKRYRVSVSWKRSPRSRRRAANSYDLDISHYHRLMRLGGGEPLVEMAREVKKLREALSQWSQGSGRLAVDIHTERDRAHEQEEQEQWFASASAELDKLQTQTNSDGAPPDDRSL